MDNSRFKFRAWDTKADNPQIKGVRGVMICDEWLKDNPKAFNYSLKNNVNEIYLMQYTGLKDKNGKEIYEGDVLKVIDPMDEEDNQCIVEWLDNNSCYQYESQHGFGDFEVTSIGWAMQMEFSFEIIGNIYENPELIKP